MPPMEDAMDALTRTVQDLDQRLAACRDANGLLTAKMVSLEIQLKRSQEELARVRHERDGYTRRIDSLLWERDLAEEKVIDLQKQLTAEMD